MNERELATYEREIADAYARFDQAVAAAHLQAVRLEELFAAMLDALGDDAEGVAAISEKQKLLFRPATRPVLKSTIH